MTPIAALPVSTRLLAELANPAARALLLAGAAGLGLAAFRVKAVSVRLFTWTTVLYAALAMPLLGWMLPPMPIPAPAFLRYGVNPVPSEIQAAHSVALEPSSGEAFIANHAAANEISSRKITRRDSSSPLVSQARPDKSVTASQPAEKLDPPFESQTTGQKTGLILAFNALRYPKSASSIQIHWGPVAAAVYLAVALLLLARFFVGLALGRRLMRASQSIDEPRLRQALASRAYASGLAFIPQAAESEFISVPITMGALGTTILLPAGWREWDDAKLYAVLAHEVSHVARRDALTQRVSLLHRAIFWFSPLAWWLNRHLADLAEQASDEAALSGGADRNDYARTLLGFFEALQAVPGRVWWQGVSMAKAGQAEKRVERILSWKGCVAMGVKNMSVKNLSIKKSIAVGLIVLAVPVVYLTASARLGNYNAGPQRVEFAQDQTPPLPPAPKAEPSATPGPAATPQAAPASEMPPPPKAAAPSSRAPSDVAPALAPGMIRGTIRGEVSGVPSRAVAPVAPAAAVHSVGGYPPYPHVYPPHAVMVPPLPPDMARVQSSGSGPSHGGFSYHYGYDDEQRFVIVSGKTDALTMSGSMDDAHHVEKLRKQIQGDFIWFQRDEKCYIIRDQATIDRARKFWEPQQELGKKQEELGKQQEALGKQQEEIGAQMELIHVKPPDMTAELDKLKAELKALSSGATMEQIGQIQSEIGDLQSKLGDIQSQAGEQQSKLGEQQGALGEKQGKLGEEQGKLGEQQAELAKQATRHMKELFDEAIKNGTAQPEI
jgi:beta-lactamase regulating signal transducer with metallopeptidase domain